MGAVAEAAGPGEGRREQWHLVARGDHLEDSSWPSMPPDQKPGNKEGGGSRRHTTSRGLAGPPRVGARGQTEPGTEVHDIGQRHTSLRDPIVQGGSCGETRLASGLRLSVGGTEPRAASLKDTDNQPPEGRRCGFSQRGRRGGHSLATSARNSLADEQHFFPLVCTTILKIRVNV